MPPLALTLPDAKAKASSASRAAGLDEARRGENLS